MSTTELKIFRFEASEVRTTLDAAGDPWWVAADVCRVLEISNSRDALGRLDADEKGVVTADTPGGRQELATVNESGLWSLVLTSRKPEAKRFKKFLTSEVIPSLRKTGRFEMAPTEDPVLASARNVVAMLERQAETDRRLAAIESSASDTSARVGAIEATVTGDTRYMALIGYARLHGLGLSRAELAAIGGRLTRECRSAGVELKPIFDEHYGRINGYPVEVLDRWRASLRQVASA